MKHEDFEREPCQCGDCQQAGVSNLIQIRDRLTGRWIHGYPLKKWYEARDAFWTAFHAQAQKRAMK
jgi:hypothetical protein